jgi:hypothetical protein
LYPSHIMCDYKPNPDALKWYHFHN